MTPRAAQDGERQRLLQEATMAALTQGCADGAAAMGAQTKS